MGVPFGGPASSPWSFGGSAVAASTPAPTPIPVPACISADLFSDCFTGCDEVGNCGWTIITPAGTVTFDGTKIIEGSFGANTQGEAQKSLAFMPAGAFTAQYEFTEIAAATPNKTYAVGMFDALGNAIFAVSLLGDGSLFAGDQTNIFIGTWTPVPGATHTVHVTDDGAGTMTLYIDGVLVPLIFLAPGPITGTASVVDLSIDNDDLDGQGSYDSVFLTNGILPPSEVFCCP